MKAIVQTGYGSPDVLELQDIDKPVVKDDEVLVRVHAAALHAGDIFCMHGEPFIVRFASRIPQTQELRARIRCGRPRGERWART